MCVYKSIYIYEDLLFSPSCKNCVARTPRHTAGAYTFYIYIKIYKSHGCIHIGMYVCMYITVCVYVYIYIYICVCTNLYIYIYMRICSSRPLARGALERLSATPQVRIHFIYIKTHKVNGCMHKYMYIYTYVYI